MEGDCVLLTQDDMSEFIRQNIAYKDIIYIYMYVCIRIEIEGSIYTGVMAVKEHTHTRAHT